MTRRKEPEVLVLPEEVLDALDNIRQWEDTSRVAFSDLAIAEYELAKRRAAVEASYSNCIIQKQQLHDHLFEKYGEGALDTEKGIFIPE
jgi:hypothetical protein